MPDDFLCQKQSDEYIPEPEDFDKEEHGWGDEADWSDEDQYVSWERDWEGMCNTKPPHEYDWKGQEQKRPCDRCGEHVPIQNDARVFDCIVEALEDGKEINWSGLLFHGSRHLLPTEHCEGSPSRAQYLPNQPKDYRGDYEYNTKYEALCQRAHQILILMEDK